MMENGREQGEKDELWIGYRLSGERGRERVKTKAFAKRER
jgi:hypothetical protein